MKVINARNVNDAYRQGMDYMSSLVEQPGCLIPSRIGQCIRAPEPVTTVYSHPCERVLFDRIRDANPLFHYFEAFWMLAGRNDLASLLPFNSKFGAYSDDGVSLNGAYGFRWREHFDYDQLNTIVLMLARDPWSRRAVLAMWDGMEDLGAESKDVPCNLSVKFVNEGEERLGMIVFNRSNDMIWGAYGANSVHMSVLQEYVAARLGWSVGTYSQVAADFHCYVDVFAEKERVGKLVQYDGWSYLEQPRLYNFPLFNAPEVIDSELSWAFDQFTDLRLPGHAEKAAQYIRAVAMEGPHPLRSPANDGIRVLYQVMWINELRLRGSLVEALAVANTIRFPDWKYAIQQWLLRRIDARAARTDSSAVEVQR